MYQVDMYRKLKEKYNFDIICIQGTKENLNCYGEGANLIAKDFNLDLTDFSSEKILFLRLNAIDIDKYESHFQNYEYSFAILELSISNNSEFREQKYTVTKTSNKNALGEFFDNRKKDGTFPKIRRTKVEDVISGVLFNSKEHTKSPAQPSLMLKPNEEQATVLKKIDKWVNNDNKNSIAILAGRAGTGKTTLLKFVVSLLQERKKTYSLLCPTGRAARILARKTNEETSTIHKEIYVLDTDKMKMDKDHEKQQLAFEESNFSLDFKLKAEENLSQVYIVDESSMVGDKKSAQGKMNFGTGRLLSDLLLQIGILRKNVNTKILFVGDYAQLPPIKEKISPALDKQYLLNEFKLKFEPEFFQLTGVLRQNKGSLILKNCEEIRSHIEQKDLIPFKLDIDGKSVRTTTPTEIKNNTIEVGNFNERIVITRSNATAYHYNKGLRERVFGAKKKSESILEGDIILVTSNSQLFKCFNGDLYKVMSLEKSEKRIIRLEKSKQYKGKPETISLFYRNIVIRPIEFLGGDYNDDYNQSIKIIENVLLKEEIFLSPSETVAIHVDWNNKIRDKDLTVEEKKENFLSDPYINAVVVKYGYAITCHKAQGGEWADVCIYFGGNWHEDYRWAYTALSRATEKLSFINLPSTYIK